MRETPSQRRDLNIRSHDAGVVPTEVESTLLCSEPL